MKFRALVLAALAVPAFASAGSVYLALGDSIAYGLTPDPSNPYGYNVPSDGNRFYVASVAGAIGSLEGSAPKVINLAIPDETSTSFADTSNVYRVTNTNYAPYAATPISQLAFAQQEIAAYGSSISTVSFALGANDFLSLSGSLQTDPTAIQKAFTNISGSYYAFLTTLRAELPSARLLLPGYYNPYLPSDPEHAVANPVILQLNALIQGYATQFGGRYVDFYTPIEGNEATLLASGNIHPNAAGYAVLGGVAAQATPEPAPMAALGLGALVLLRRRRTPAPQ